MRHVLPHAPNEEGPDEDPRASEEEALPEAPPHEAHIQGHRLPEHEGGEEGVEDEVDMDAGKAANSFPKLFPCISSFRGKMLLTRLERDILFENAFRR